MRLLLIDDSRLDRKMIKRLISQARMDASVAEADGAKTALGMVAVEHFDCILIDYNLPGSDGVTLADQIATDYDRMAVPMVMLTAEPSPTLATKALTSGLSDFLSKKSLTGDQLCQALCNALIRKQELRRLPGDSDDCDPARQTPSPSASPIDQALALLDQSSAFEACLEQDCDVAFAIELLRSVTKASESEHDMHQAIPGISPPLAA